MITLKDMFRTDNVTSTLYKSNKYLNQGANYLSIGDVTVLLNQLFDGNWSFEIVKAWSEVYQAYNNENISGKEGIKDTYFYVHGRLTVKALDNDGNVVEIVKEDIGSDCPRKTDKNKRYDYESGYKSAVSDAIKGCAANLDIGVFDEKTVESIRTFVNNKKIFILKNQLGEEFNNFAKDFAKEKDIEVNEILGTKYARTFIDYLENKLEENNANS